ncbi:MAG: polysaccharide deacetylase family protein [Oscillibacter sp.]
MNLSVRFFKRLFLGILVAIIIIPIITSICFGISAGRAKKQVAELTQKIQAENLTVYVKDEEETELKTVVKDDVAATPDPDLPYQSLYPDLYCDTYKPSEWVREENTVYLTFDDGPSSNTEKVLTILREANIKATFFVTGRGDVPKAETLKKIVDEGHTLALHTYTHDYGNIYASVEAYLDDFNQIYQLVYESTGVKPELFRFPGGSINGYNGAVYQPLIAEMTRRGFAYFDWNVSGQDASNVATVSSITQSVVQGVSKSYRAIVLLHDSADKGNTIKALPGMISEIKKQGFSFAPLTTKTKPIAFSYGD